MNNGRNILIAALMLVALALTSGWALAAAPAGPEAVAPKETPAKTDEPAVKDPAKDTEELEKLLEGVTPEQLEKIIKMAVEQRLKVERDQVKREITDNLLYEPDAVAAAVASLEKDPANTQRDNIDRICKAFAKADAAFGKAYKLFEEKNYKDAAEALKKLLNAQQSTYLSAAQHFLYADALARTDNVWDAVDAYAVVLAEMPDRISLAAASAANSADMMDKKGRRLYALKEYIACLKNYGLTLSKEEYDAIFKKVEDLQKIYRDPLGTAANMMGDVQKRLDAVDSGKETQTKEKEIVALLEDLIKTAEENQKASSQSQGQGQKKGQGQCSKCGQKGCNGQCQGQGQGQAQGQSNSPPSGTRIKPSSPAMRSALVPGAVERPSKLSAKYEGSEVGDWAELPPRERERLQAIGKKLMSDRYRDAIGEYRTRLAKVHQDTGAEK